MERKTKPSIQPTTSSGVERFTTPYSVSHSSSGPKGSKLVRKFLNANILSELDGSILSTILCSASTFSVIVLKDVFPHFVAMIVRVRYSNFRKILTMSENFVRRYAFLFAAIIYLRDWLMEGSFLEIQSRPSSLQSLWLQCTSLWWTLGSIVNFLPQTRKCNTGNH